MQEKAKAGVGFPTKMPWVARLLHEAATTWRQTLQPSQTTAPAHQ